MLHMTPGFPTDINITTLFFISPVNINNPAGRGEEEEASPCEGGGPERGAQ